MAAILRSTSPDPVDLTRAREPGRGREANTPEQIPVLGWKDICLRVLWSIPEDRILTTSGGVAFFALLAIFPAIATVVSLYGIFADASTIGAQLAMLAGFLPGGVLQLILDQIVQVTEKGAPTLSVAFTIGFFIALWTANSGMAALFDALNVAYGEKEKESTCSTPPRFCSRSGRLALSLRLSLPWSLCLCS